MIARSASDLGGASSIPREAGPARRSFPPGGGTDTMARVLAPKLSEGIGQPVVIDNRGGAGATIGTELAAKAPPDGYTLLLMTVTNAVGCRSLHESQIRPRAGLCAGHPARHHAARPRRASIGAGENVKELVALAKARPGALVYSSSGTGSVSHLGANTSAI